LNHAYSKFYDKISQGKAKQDVPLNLADFDRKEALKFLG